MKPHCLLAISCDRCGISNAIVTLILVGMAIVGGLIAYISLRGYMDTATTNVSIQVQYLNAITVAGGRNYASASVKNAGSVRLENVIVTIINSDGPDVRLRIGTLDPGQTGSAKALHDLAAGVTYPVQVTADTPNGGGDGVTVSMKVRVS